MCYTYDERSRVTQRTNVNYNTGETIDETFTYDAAGNIISATDDNCYTKSFSYDKNNRVIYHNGMSVTYDADGNTTSLYRNGIRDIFRYDSTNRLIRTNTNAYTYNAENVRIRNLCGDSETTYVYNTNAKLSSMLMKTTDGVVTKYVYGRGLIGEETNGSFKVYHFDYRGSTVAITDINGNVTDRFEYDTYGKLTSRTGTSDVIFLYNGRDGVVTDANGLIYMRARYYSPELRRFINADILAGRIDNAVTLNRYAYANANPVSLVDPRGLSADGRGVQAPTKSEPGKGTYLDKDAHKLKPIYTTEVLESDALKKIQDNADAILYYAEKYGVDPNVVASVIFVEQYFNYDYVDVCTDWVAVTGIIDMSVGLGQVRMSTAEFLEEEGYVDPILSTPIANNSSIIPAYLVIVPDYETTIRYLRLANDETNIMHVAAYIKYFEDTWSEEFPEISESPDILGTLYNIGHHREPHSNPVPTLFGKHTEYFYDLMGETLS